MSYRSITFYAAVLFACIIAVPASASTQLPGTGADVGNVVIYRDTWGVPHIYAPTEEAGMFAMGYAQAQDRPHQLLENFKRAMGEASSIHGRSQLREDVVVHMFDHYGSAKRDVDDLDPQARKNMQAFAAGVNAYYEAHPEDVPEWWGNRKVDEYMSDAFSRLFLYGWSISQAFGDLRRAGIEPGVQEMKRGSNQWAVSPQRSATGTAILYIDPHLSWHGVSRFWEFRIHAGAIKGSGFSLPGNPYIGLGHNEHVAWAMTTGGPDTADIFELTLNANDPTQYLYDGAWRHMTKKEVAIEVKGEGTHNETIYYSHHGPIVAFKDGKAYAAKSAYSDATHTREAWYHMNHATDYTGLVKGMDTLAVFPQNVMVADTSGNIYYQRTGRVPIRPQEFNYDYPVNGSTSETEWQGVHPTSDLLQVLNPPQGYMQNCNIPPDAMMVNSPFALEKTLPYIFSDRSYGPNRDQWTNPRGARAVELLHNDESVTIEDALAYAVDIQSYGYDRWLEVLRRADEKFGNRYRRDAEYQSAVNQLLDWNGELHRNSAPALKYAYWRQQIIDDWGQQAARGLASRVDHYHLALGHPDKPIEVSDEELESVLASFHNSLQTLKSHWGSVNAKFGDKYRVGRDDKSWPVGGGGPTDIGLSVLRNIGYSNPQDDHTQWGRSGQTSTQIVVMTQPIQSWTFVPLGQSDRPESPHYSDQAEQLFSERVMKPTWWLPEDLAKHIASREVIPYDGAADSAVAGLSDEEQVQAIIEQWKSGLESQDVAQLTAHYADDYQDGQATGKAEAVRWLEEITSQGMLSNARVRIVGSKTNVSPVDALVSGVRVASDAGQWSVDIYLKKDGADWKIISIDIY